MQGKCYVLNVGVGGGAFKNRIRIHVGVNTVLTTTTLSYHISYSFYLYYVFLFVSLFVYHWLLVVGKNFNKRIESFACQSCTLRLNCFIKWPGNSVFVWFSCTAIWINKQGLCRHIYGPIFSSYEQQPTYRLAFLIPWLHGYKHVKSV